MPYKQNATPIKKFNRISNRVFKPFNFCCLLVIKIKLFSFVSSNFTPDPGLSTLNSKDSSWEAARIEALKEIRRSLERISKMSASNLIFETAGYQRPNISSEKEAKDDKEIFAENDGFNNSKKAFKMTFRNVQAELREISPQDRQVHRLNPSASNEEGESVQNAKRERIHRHSRRSVGKSRELLNTNTRGLLANILQHKRRRKGCPHTQAALLCPSRNSHHYDVCITRDQLCDHVVDCPNGEDEDPQKCFIYKPLDDQLKLTSHAVLLLIDSVLNESNKENKNEL